MVKTNYGNIYLWGYILKKEKDSDDNKQDELPKPTNIAKNQEIDSEQENLTGIS